MRLCLSFFFLVCSRLLRPFATRLFLRRRAMRPLNMLANAQAPAPFETLDVDHSKAAQHPRQSVTLPFPLFLYLARSGRGAAKGSFLSRPGIASGIRYCVSSLLSLF